MANLEAALNAAEIRSEATEALQALIDKVVLTPDPDATNGLRVELHGDLATILEFSSDESRGPAGGHRKLRETGVPGSQLSVVAGAGFEPAAFRL